MSSRLALAIEWDHVSKTKTKQKTGRKLSPSPSLHPQRSSFNPLYQGLALHLFSLQALPIFHVTLINTGQAHATPWKPESYQGSKVFEHWLEATSGKPHIRAYVPSHRGIENYMKWHLSCVCEVWVKRKFLCSGPGCAPKSFCVVHSNTATSKTKRNSQHIWSQAFQIRDTQSVSQDLFYPVVFDSCRGLCVACRKSCNSVVEECFWAHPPFLPVLRLAASSLSKRSSSVAVPVYLFWDR